MSDFRTKRAHLRTYTEARCVARPSTFPARRVRSEGGAAHTGVAPRGCSNALAAGGRAAPAYSILKWNSVFDFSSSDDGKTEKRERNMTRLDAGVNRASLLDTERPAADWRWQVDSACRACGPQCSEMAGLPSHGDKGGQVWPP